MQGGAAGQRQAKQGRRLAESDYRRKLEGEQAALLESLPQAIELAGQAAPIVATARCMRIIMFPGECRTVVGTRCRS